MRLRYFALSVTLLAGLVAVRAGAEEASKLRPPAVPLVAVDPYFSIWSAADNLTDADRNGNPTVVHWTGTPNQLTSLVKIDGKSYRIMGIKPSEDPALPQTALQVLPTTVSYTFEGAGVRVGLSFFTPLMPADLMIFSRPVTYLTWDVRSLDANPHDVEIYYDNTAELVVNNARTEKVIWSTEKFGDISALKIGSVEQPVLRMKGDRVRINWGYEYVAVDASQQAKLQIAAAEAARKAWGAEPAGEAIASPIEAAQAPVLSATFKLGKVTQAPVSRWLMLAYDDVESAVYFGRHLKAYWKKDGATIGDMLKKSAAEYATLRASAAKFDQELMADLEKSGGPDYAWICALAYRQSLAASKVIADTNGQPLYFCKENSSNGCMGTVDVFYPQAPLPLLISPSLAKAMLIPVLEYGSSPRWRWPNAPHDVGTWPQANGQVYGGARSNGGMPVEETGNMLLLVAAVAQVEGNAEFAAKYWPTLTKWANYLEQYGRDPENQLCTDDFAGRLAHNANLGAKAICALGAFGKLAAMRGDKEVADKYSKMAKEYALGWVKQSDDGDHSRLAFDKPDTWSSKYNLVWDKILGMNLFPDEAIKKEVAYYRQHLDKYGLPLDGRLQRAGGRGANTRMAYWSKTDWAFWTACLTNNDDDFAAITAPAYKYFNETTQRVGLADLYFTDLPDIARFQARPVVGGLFIKMLYNPEVWKKWAARDMTKANGPWAPLPEMPRIVEVVKPGTTAWRYTTTEPAEGWSNATFDDSSWKQGTGGFGSRGTPGADIKNEWTTADIWLRGEITIPEGTYNNLQLSLYHDEDAEIYIDGVRAVRATGFNSEYEPTAVDTRVTLKPGKFKFAVHCHQTTGGQFIDLGIVDVQPVK